MNVPERLRRRVEYLGFRTIQAAATALPLETVSWSSGLAWRLIAPRLHRQERALGNLKLAFPGLSEAERKRLAAAMWENLGRTFGESFRLKEIIAE
jgi:Kdo2-lipid IVA lauroyltransferase/acyltransferase